MNTQSNWGTIQDLEKVDTRLSAKYPELATFFQQTDYWEIKEISSTVNLRQFISGLLGYMPWWIRLLFSVREMFARIIGLKTPANDLPRQISPENLSFTPGDQVTFFFVSTAKEDAYWLAEAIPDKHLAAWFGVVTLDEGKPEKNFLVITLVRYKNRIGPFYFRSILPFHHLIVNQMMLAAAGRRKQHHRLMDS